MTVPYTSRRLLTIAGLGVAFFTLLTYAVFSGVTQQFDDAVLLWLNGNAQPWVDTFFIIFTELGGTVVLTVATALLVGGFLWKKHFKKAGFVAAAVGGSALIMLLLKAFFERDRPELWDLLVHVTNFSYPSGHAFSSSAFAVVAVVLLWHTKWRTASLVIGAFYVAFVGISRLYLGVHYPTDIIGGWVLGMTWLALLSACYVRGSRPKELEAQS